jgi:hypothetical protein
MEIVKKHILSVVCGVVALVAVVLAFWPLGSMKEKAQTDLNTRSARYSQIQSLRTRQRHLPTVDMGTSEAPLLPGFPTDSAIKKAQTLAEKVAAEKSSVIRAAEESNARELLVPQSLPNSAGNTAFEFKARYLETVAQFPKLIGAGQPPTAAEIEAAKLALWETQYKPNILRPNGVEDPISAADQKKAFDREVLDLPEKEKYHRAAQIKVYVAPEVFQPNTGIATAGGSAPSRKTIWYAQLNLWLQTDIASAITAANKPYRDVVAAPVKNWLSLRVDPYRREGIAPGANVGGYGSSPSGPPGGGYGTSPTAPPGYGYGAPTGPAMAPAAAAPTGSGEPKFDLSPTGRVCNTLYDVVPFTLVVDVQANQIPMFLQELGRNRLIAPTSVSIQPLDANTLLASPYNYVYGSDPVARVTISAEALYLRSWTEKLMPDEVKVNDLGIVSSAGTPGL